MSRPPGTHRASRAGLHPLGKVAKSPAVSAMCKLMPQHHHDGERPFDDLNGGHEGEAGVPAKAGMRTEDRLGNARQLYDAAAL